jgi:hypothetical protein
MTTHRTDCHPERSEGPVSNALEFALAVVVAVADDLLL